MKRLMWSVGLALLLVAGLVAFTRFSNQDAYSQAEKLKVRGHQVEVAPGVARSEALETRVKKAAQDLLDEAPELQSLREKSFAVEATTTVKGKSAKGDDCATEALFLLKDTYTAQLVEITFTVDAQGKSHDKKVNTNYRPAVKPVGPPVARDAKLEEDKGKAFKYQDRGMKAEDPAAALDLKEAYEKAKAHEEAQEKHSWFYATGLANTSAPQFASAMTATQQIYGIFYTAFLPSNPTPSALRDCYGSPPVPYRLSTKKEITDFLKYDNRLLAWNNIGHGVTSPPNGSPCYGLVQWDATIWYTDFNTLSPYIGIYWCVALANSCNSNVDPLKAAILTRRPRTYIGGNILLPVGVSEYVDVDFWYYVLLRSPHMTMAAALPAAQTHRGMGVGSFGLNGQTGYF